MHIHTLLTHEYPDLDGLVGCWLLRRFGADRFPGTDTAALRFLPAGFQLEGQTPEEQEASGALAVDIGGGRFDNHIHGRITGDEADLEQCATSLIAEELELGDRPGIARLVEFVRLQDTRGRSISSRSPEDHAFALVSILRGLHFQNGDDYTKTFEDLCPMLDAIAAVDEGSDAVIEWYRSSDVIPVKLGRREHMADQPFDAAALRWLADRYQLPAVPEVTDRDLRGHQTATGIVARATGLEDRGELRKLLKFANLERVRGNGAYLGDLDFTVTMLNILRGFHALHRDPEEAAKALFPCLDAMHAMERDWIDALEEFPRCSRLLSVGKGQRRVRVCAFESDSPSMARVARFKSHPDLSIHRDTEIGAIGMTLMQYQGRLREFTFDGRGGHPSDDLPAGQPRLDSVAARVRLAEAMELGEEPQIERLNDVGTVHGWFLHQSLRIFAKGSRKARDVPPTLLPFDVLVELVASTFDPGRKLPDYWCPTKRCPAGECVFAELRLANCQG